MGVVYEAADPALGRQVALKTVQAALTLSPAERAAFEKRFVAEARVAAGLSHPGIVIVHDVGRDEATDTLYIALELLHGQTLAQRMLPGQPLPWREAVGVALRVARALQHAHERGIVHRDVKPANIMILAGDEPKIMDFGIAKVPAAQLTSPGEFFGTPSYMSPEQAAGTEVDARSDLFSLGSVLFLMLTGRRAFDGPNVPAILGRVAHRDPPRPSALVELPEPLDYVVARALSKAPALRYADGGSFAEDLEDVLGDLPPRHRPGWVEPPRNELPLAEVETARELPTADLSPGRARPAALTASVTRQAGPEAGPRRWRPLALALLVFAALTVLLLRPRPAGPLASPAAPPRPGASASAPAPQAPAASPSAEVVRSLPRWPWSSPPGKLEVDFAHALKAGQLRVWVDEELVIDAPLQGKVTKKVLFVYKRREGSVNEAIEVTPGEHSVRVQVDSDEAHWTNKINARFASGETRRLLARLQGGFLEDKQVELGWARAAGPS